MKTTIQVLSFLALFSNSFAQGFIGFTFNNPYKIYYYSEICFPKDGTKITVVCQEGNQIIIKDFSKLANDDKIDVSLNTDLDLIKHPDSVLILKNNISSCYYPVAVQTPIATRFIRQVKLTSLDISKLNFQIDSNCALNDHGVQYVFKVRGKRKYYYVFDIYTYSKCEDFHRRLIMSDGNSSIINVELF